jgi:soluble lytic murein transglycosylase-like protein
MNASAVVARSAQAAPLPLEARAAAGDAAATTELALRYELGLGVAADPPRAMALFCRAAGLGSRPAMLHVAAWLLTDDGPDYDPALAARWLQRLQRMERGQMPGAREKPPRCPTETATGLPSAAHSIGTLVDNLAPLHGVDPALVKAIIAVESGYQSNAISHAGAAGLMQLMPRTAQELGVTDRFNIEQNLRGGIAHLAQLLAAYRGNIAFSLAAYNAGAAAVDACGCIPDNGETVQYVNRVRELYNAATAVPARAAPNTRTTRR